MKDDEIDSAIDLALSTYTAVEPPVGLERRILSRIHARRAMRYAWFLAALPALAAAVLIGIHLEPDVIGPPAPFHAIIRLPPLTEVRTVARRIRIKPRRERLTREERYLLEMAKFYPLQAQEALSQLRERADTELEIKALEITPLNTEENNP